LPSIFLSFQAHAQNSVFQYNSGAATPTKPGIAAKGLAVLAETTSKHMPTAKATMETTTPFGFEACKAGVYTLLLLIDAFMMLS
jgi:hypothetical protein